MGLSRCACVCECVSNPSVLYHLHQTLIHYQTTDDHTLLSLQVSDGGGDGVECDAVLSHRDRCYWPRESLVLLKKSKSCQLMDGQTDRPVLVFRFREATKQSPESSHYHLLLGRALLASPTGKKQAYPSLLKVELPSCV